MNFDLKPRRIGKTARQPTPRFGIGDKVVLQHLSNASLNLYEKLRSSGYTYIKCPCNLKSTVSCTIEKAIGNGFILRASEDFLSVACACDLRKV